MPVVNSTLRHYTIGRQIEYYEYKYRDSNMEPIFYCLKQFLNC